MSSLSSVGGTNSALGSTGSATGTLSVGGLITGLNTNQLIQGLLAVQQARAYSVIPKPVSKNVVIYTVVRALLRAYGEQTDSGSPPGAGGAD